MPDLCFEQGEASCSAGDEATAAGSSIWHRSVQSMPFHARIDDGLADQPSASQQQRY
ncbi:MULTISPECIES: hypothetical protein [Deefgea]|uniref:Uncharacterized protein n=1 Tax=Deefgea chitinilytica TaxID=570276 RepID=A0ABS2CEC2_9NEIS|nr:MULTISPECIES: hypothetical protein [Deefgea]MBM5572412.1 hypothetical protein [Deefgea chitinilytica]MBM9889648.1 hypothetical protein [Deefgea sp. CFH1-16]